MPKHEGRGPMTLTCIGADETVECNNGDAHHPVYLHKAVTEPLDYHGTHRLGDTWCGDLSHDVGLRR